MERLEALDAGHALSLGFWGWTGMGSPEGLQKLDMVFIILISRFVFLQHRWSLGALL